MKVPLANHALYQLPICNICVVLLPRTHLVMVVVLVLATRTVAWEYRHTVVVGPRHGSIMWDLLLLLCCCDAMPSFPIHLYSTPCFPYLLACRVLDVGAEAVCKLVGCSLIETVSEPSV